MKIHLYATCWNDAHMLGFFFRHYDPFVDRYVIYDDGSTDRSLEILASNSKVEIRPPSLTSHPESFTLSEITLSDSCWKECRGIADWVIVTDIDEHLYHPEMQSYLKHCQDRGITIVPALGYQMLSDEFPKPDQFLCRDLTMGAPWVQMNKLSIFSPDSVEEINFQLGRHSAAPTGRVVAPDRDELLLLHYKYLGFWHTQRRHEEYVARLRKTDLAKGWTARYLLSADQMRADWQNFAAQLVDVSRPDLAPWQSHPAPRWWEQYRRCHITAAAKAERAEAGGGDTVGADFPLISSQGPHPNDLPAHDLAAALATAKRPDLLNKLVEISRNAFGFYTRAFQYTIHYPWAGEWLESLPPGSHVLEIGAGVNPLPLFLAQRGVFVDCVDDSALVRSLPVGDDWDNWGFFDYGQLDAKLTAYHCDITKFKPAHRYDAIYSIGAIATMPAAVRKETFRLCREWLQPHGIVLAMIGLIPGTDLVWNRSRGVQVEPQSQHGTIADIVCEATASGLEVAEPYIVRNVPKAPVDLLYLDCRCARADKGRSERLLIYAMESSGASTFCYFLAQRPGSVAIVDLWSGCVAPPLELPHPVVIKATTNMAFRAEDHVASFTPDRTILFIRDPVAVYSSLIKYRHGGLFGTVEEKMARFDNDFANGKFDIVLRYEDFVTRDPRIIEEVNNLGWECNGEYYNLSRNSDAIKEFNLSASEWMRDNYPQCWGFGNFKGPTVSADFTKPEHPAAVIEKVIRLSPHLSRYYAR